MESNKYIRAHVLVFLGTLASFQVNAFTGGVTTYSGQAGLTVERAVTAAAKAGPEFDATYQRTMRSAQTAAAAGKLARGLLRTFTGLGLLLTAVEFSHDMGWTGEFAGTLTKPDPNACAANCVTVRYTVGSYKSAAAAPSTSCQDAISGANAINAAGGGTYVIRTYSGVQPDGERRCLFNTKTSSGVDYGPGSTPAENQLDVAPTAGIRPTVTDAEIEDQLKAWPGLPRLLDDMEKAGKPVPFVGDPVEDLPQPLVLSPRTTLNPDGSKRISTVTLRPYRGPDGKTINWERSEVVQEVSAPDAQGNTVTRTTTTTSNGGPSASSEPPKTDDRPECEKSPNSLGCIEMDQPTGEIPKATKDVSYVAETLFGSGACPANKTIAQTLTGRPIVLSYAPTCDALSTYVKPIIIAIALFMAYLIILPGNRE